MTPTLPPQAEPHAPPLDRRFDGATIVPTISLLELYVRRWPDGVKATLGVKRTTEAVQLEAMRVAVQSLADELGVKPADLAKVLGLRA